jgi:hypothetical protein
MNLVYILIVFSLLYVLQMFFTRNIFLKLIVVTYLFLVSSAIYFSIDTYKGWPSSDKILKGTLVAVEILEPNDTHEGAIYLWVYDEKKEESLYQKVFHYKQQLTAPRSYVIPYTKKSKEIFEDAKKQIEMGMTVELSAEGDGTEVEATGKSTDKELNSNTKGADDYDVPSVNIIPPNEILRKN